MRDLVEDQVAVAEDRREQVVKIVCEPTRQMSDGFHLLSLKELIFGFTLNRDILGERHNVFRLSLLFEERKFLHS